MYQSFFPVLRHNVATLLCSLVLACAAFPALRATDLPPTIATAAAATPATVTTKTTKLTVTGADDGGPAALTYAWTATGPGAVIFNVTATNAAKTVTATFSTAGSYVCTATVSDAVAQTATSSVTVTVSPTLTTFVIAPTTAVVNPSQTKLFTVTPKDQFGALFAGNPTWTATGAGTVDQTGLFTAGATSGSASVNGALGTKTASATVRVNAAPTVANPVSTATAIITGATADLSVQGADDASVDLLNYTWTATGPKAVTFKPRNGVTAEQTIATFATIGDYTLIATITDKEGLTVTSSLTVSVTATPTTATVAPATTAVVNPGASQAFVASIRDQFKAIMSMPPAITWAVTAGAGAIDATGLYTAALPSGAATISATCGASVGTTVGTAVGTATLRINAAPTVATAVATTALTIGGKTADFSMQGADDASIDLLTYTWTSTGPKAVIFAPKNGVNAEQTVATFAAIGDYVITATITDTQKLSDTSTLAVSVTPTATSVVIAPATAALNPSSAKVFAATVRDQFTTNLVSQPALTWTATGGTVDAAGRFTAGTIAGPASVTAAFTSAGTATPTLSATATIRVNAPPTVAQAAAVGTATPVAQAPITLSVLGADDAGEAALIYTWAVTAGSTTGVTFSGATNGSNAAKAISMTVPTPGTYTVRATLRDAQGLTVTSNVAITVNKAIPVITWAPPAAIPYGTTLSAAQLHATTPISGTFSYAPALGTVLSVGLTTLTTTFTPTNSATYATGTASVQLTVTQAMPVIHWGAPAPIFFGTPLSSAQLQATASVGGTFTYAPQFGTVLPAGSQTLTATFTPVDTVSYATANAAVTLVVQPAVPVVTWAPPAAIPWGTALSPTQLNATSPTPGSFAYTPALGTTPEVGSHTLTVTCTPSDAANFTTATLSVPLTVTRAVTVITWTAPNAITWGAALSATELTAVSSVAGALAYTPALGTVLDVGTTTLSVAFTPTDTAHYTGSTASVPLLIKPATPSLTWTPPFGITWGTALSATQLSATSPIPGTPMYTPASGTVLEVGASTLSVTWNPTDAVHYTTATTTVTIVVERALPIVTWPTPSAIASDTPLSATQLTATATYTGTTLPGTFTYTPGSGTTLSAGTHALQAMFTPTDSGHYLSVSAAVSILVTAPVVTVTGYVTTYVYDDANRLTERKYDNAASDTFAYDAAGRMRTATSGRYANTITRDYDAASRVQREAITIDGRELEIKSAYDDANRLTQQTYPDSSQVSRDYTPRNELAHVFDGQQVIAARAYDAGGRLQTTQFGNGLSESRTYAPGDRMVATISIPGVTDFTYTYDANKLKISEVDNLAPTQSQYFGYDQADRVTSWKRKTAPTATPVAIQNWTLSPVGDWSSTTTAADGTTAVQNRLHSAVHELVDINGTALLYDLKGNLTQDDQGQRYTWDGENRLASATSLQQGHGESATYAHDALGRRVKKTVTATSKAVSTYFISAGAQELVEITGDLSAFNDPAADPESAGAAPFNPATGTGARGSLLADPSATRINFQPMATDTPDGWQADVGTVTANAGSRGWTAALTGTERDHLGRPLYDTFIPLGTETWQIPVTNGVHAVAIMCGDADSRAQTNNLTVNGIALTDLTPYDGIATLGYETGSFDGYTATITVTNGLLKITAGSGALAPKINFIEIGAVGSSIDQVTADGVQAAAVQATHDTGKPKAKMPPMVKRSFFQSYVDDLAGYTLQKPRHAPQTYWVASNHLFSPAAVSNSSGQVITRYTYDTYGRQTIRNGAGVVIDDDTALMGRGFTGYSQYCEVELYYARARMYSARLGRFIQKDKYKKSESRPSALDGYPSGFNLYSSYFVPGQLDPSGNCQIDIAVFFEGIWTLKTQVFAYPWATASNSPMVALSNVTPLVFGVWNESLDQPPSEFADFIISLARGCCIRSLNISNHGGNGGIQFGNSFYGSFQGAAEEFSQPFKDSLSRIRAQMCKQGRVNLYQCNVGDDGTDIRHEQLKKLSFHLGVPVSAPDVLTQPWPRGTMDAGLFYWYTSSEEN